MTPIYVNATNMTLQWAMEPLYNLLGEGAMIFIFGLGFAILWTNMKSDKVLVSTIYLIITGLFGGAIFGSAVNGILILGGAIGLGFLFYQAFIKTGWGNI